MSKARYMDIEEHLEYETQNGGWPVLWLYFFKVNQKFKVGVTQNIEARVKDFTINAGVEGLEVIGLYRNTPYDDPQKIVYQCEQEILKVAGQNGYRLFGEWMRFDKEVLETVVEIVGEYDLEPHEDLIKYIDAA